MSDNNGKAALPQYTIGGITYTVLYPDVIRPLTAREHHELRESIKEQEAVLMPIVLDEDDGVIDGGNRLAIAAELGLETIPTTRALGLTDDQKRQLAEDLNDCRRQQTPEEIQARRRERVERVAAARQEGQSFRQIAEQEGVAVAQVQRDLAVAKSTVPPGTVEPATGKVTGKDGKERPATRPQTVAPAPAPEPAPTPLPGSPPRKPKDRDEPRDVPRDGTGYPVPKHLRDYFGDSYLRQTALQLRTLANVALQGIKANPWLSAKVREILNREHQQHAELYAAAVPYAVCRYCQGVGTIGKDKHRCPKCRACGWLTQWAWNEQNEDARGNGGAVTTAAVREPVYVPCDDETPPDAD